MGLYSFSCALLRPLIRLLFRFRVCGEEHLSFEAPCVVAANHISFWDPVFLACASRKCDFVFLARASLFKNPVLGLILRSIGAVPIERDGNDFSAVRTAIAQLRAGKSIVLFPQGTRCPDRSPLNTDFFDGATFIATSARVPLSPIGICTKNFRVRPFRRVTLLAGEKISPLEDRSREAIKELNARLKASICALSSGIISTERTVL